MTQYNNTIYTNNNNIYISTIAVKKFIFLYKYFILILDISRGGFLG